MTKIVGSGSRIRIHVEAWIRGSGSTPKCQGSATLLKHLQIRALYAKDLLQCCGSVSSMRIRFVSVLVCINLFNVLFLCVLGRRSHRSIISTSSRRFVSRRTRRYCSTTASRRTTNGGIFGTRWSWKSTR